MDFTTLLFFVVAPFIVIVVGLSLIVRAILRWR